MALFKDSRENQNLQRGVALHPVELPLGAPGVSLVQVMDWSYALRLFWSTRASNTALVLLNMVK